MSSELLQCPDCGDRRFNWIIKQVQFGNVHRFEDGTIDGEGMEMGEVVGSDFDELGPYCTGCDEHKNPDELVAVEEDE